MKRNKFGKTRKDTRWKRGEFVVVERVRKQSESEDGGMRELRVLRLMRLENTPEGRVVSCLLLRAEEQMKMKMKMREGRRETWNEREARLSRPSKAPEGREERLLELR